MTGQQPQSGYGSHYSGQPSVPLEVALLPPQRGNGSHYSGQPSVSSVGQGQPDNEHAQACSYVQEQLRAQIGDQHPAWDGPAPGFWDRAPQGTPQTRAGNQQTQRATTAFGQGQPMNETPLAPYHAQEQLRASQKGGSRGSWVVPATGMQQTSGHYENQHTRSPTLSRKVGYSQPATYVQGQNQHSHTSNKSGPQIYPSKSNRGGNGMNGHH